MAGIQGRKMGKIKSEDLQSVFPERSSASPLLQESLTVSTPIRILPPLSAILSDSSENLTLYVGALNVTARSIFTWDAFESRIYFVDKI